MSRLKTPYKIALIGCSKFLTRFKKSLHLMQFKAKFAIISKLKTWDPSIPYVSLFASDVLDGTQQACKTGAASSYCILTGCSNYNCFEARNPRARCDSHYARPTA